MSACWHQPSWTKDALVMLLLVLSSIHYFPPFSFVSANLRLSILHLYVYLSMCFFFIFAFSFFFVFTILCFSSLHLYVCHFPFLCVYFFCLWILPFFLFCLQICISLLYVLMFVVYHLYMSIFFIFTSSLSLLCLQIGFSPLCVSTSIIYHMLFLCVCFFCLCIFAFASQFITTFFYNGCFFFPPHCCIDAFISCPNVVVQYCVRCCNFCCSYLYPQQNLPFLHFDVASTPSFHVLMLHLNFVGVVAINVTFIHAHNNALICLLIVLHQHFHFLSHCILLLYMLLHFVL